MMLRAWFGLEEEIIKFHKRGCCRAGASAKRGEVTLLIGVGSQRLSKGDAWPGLLDALTT